MLPEPGGADARLPSGLEVGALLRLAEAQGGFGTVLHKGDADRGVLLLVLLERGQFGQVRERLLTNEGKYRWQQSSAKITDSADLAQHLVRRRRIDPDMWAIELDVPSIERFIAEMI